MFKRSRLLLAAAGSLVATAAIAGFGFAAASAAPAAAAGSAGWGIEHVQLVSASATSSTAPVILWGKFAAYGTDHQGNTVDRFVLNGGSFKVWHSEGTGTPHIYPRTCVLTITVRGTYKMYGGTGRFAGIKGHGHYVYSQVGIAKRKANGKCNFSENALPAAVQDIIRANGPVKR